MYVMGQRRRVWLHPYVSFVCMDVRHLCLPMYVVAISTTARLKVDRPYFVCYENALLAVITATMVLCWSFRHPFSRCLSPHNTMIGTAILLLPRNLTIVRAITPFCRGCSHCVLSTGSILNRSFDPYCHCHSVSHGNGQRSPSIPPQLHLLLLIYDDDASIVAGTLLRRVHTAPLISSSINRTQPRLAAAC
jgi:hypothetical protein